MPSITSTLLTAAGLLSLAQAYTQPKGDPTWGPLLTPDLSSTVVRGTKFNVTWDPKGNPTDGVTVSLVLCKGPGSNCVLQPDAFADSLPAAQKSFEWFVPCTLAAGTAKTDTGYGMAIIVDQTGEYQYSTQFSIQQGDLCQSDPSDVVSNSTYSTAPLPTSFTGSFSVSSTAKAASTTATHSSSMGMSTTTTKASAANSAAETAAPTSSTKNAAVAKATNAAGALLAIGVALLAF